MKKKPKLLVTFGIVCIVCILLTYRYVLSIVKTVNADMDAYATRIAYRDNYKLHTTPLSNAVVENICSKLGINSSSENCKPNAVVYAPELFDEVSFYFRNVPDQDKTFSNVDSVLGPYLAYCEDPVSGGRYKGHYRCKYDIRGDNIYFIYFRFDPNNLYYEVIAKPIPWDS